MRMPTIFTEDKFKFFFDSNEHRPIHAHVSHGGGEAVLEIGGLEIRFPVARNPRLAKGNDAQLNNIHVSPFGLHWPDLDEDLSFAGLSAGDYGQNQNHLATQRT